MEPALLLRRLTEIGDSLATNDTALALDRSRFRRSGTRSTGRLSDLDFFVIVKDGSKTHYLDDLSCSPIWDPLPFSSQTQKTDSSYL